MKKLFALLSSILLAAIFFVSCASTKISIQEHSPIAIFSIIGNSQVPWENEDSGNDDEPDSGGLLTSMLNKVVDGQNPEILTALDRLDYVNDSVHQIIPEMTGVEVLEKDVVVKSEAYKNLKSSYFNMLSPIKSATDYKDLTTLGAKSARVTMKEVGAKSALFFAFTFQKRVFKGKKSSGEVEGVVSMKAKLLDERGKEVVNKTYQVTTSEKIKITNSKYNKDALVEALNTAIDDAIRQFAVEFISTEGSPVAEEDTSIKGQAIALPPRKDTAKTQESESAEQPAEQQTSELNTGL